MDLNRISLLFLLGLMFLSKTGHGQQVELGLNLYAGLAHTQGWEPGMNGTSMNFDYLHGVSDKLQVKGGLELGYTGWGSQGLLATGIRYGGPNAIELEILNGMAFYQQGPNYVFGAGAAYTRSFFNEGKNRLLLSIGLRFSIQPAYKTYSPIYSYFDIPLRISWARILNKKQTP